MHVCRVDAFVPVSLRVQALLIDGVTVFICWAAIQIETVTSKHSRVCE
jgi:hypothetical protein